MLLEISEKDFEAAIQDIGIATDIEGGTRHLGGDVVASISEYLPKVIAHKVSRMVPEGFVVAKVSIKMELAGKVFGCGVAGEVSFDLCPST